MRISRFLIIASIVSFMAFSCDNSIGIDDYSDLTEEQLAEKDLICVDKDLQIYASNKTAVIVSPQWLADMTTEIARKYKPGENSTYEDLAASSVWITKYKCNDTYYMQIVDVLSSFFKETYYKKDGSVLTDQEMELFKQAYTGEQKRIYPLRADQQQP